MTADTFDVLLVEDNPGDARLFVEMLRENDELRRRVGIESTTESRFHHETTLEAGIERLAGTPVDVVLLDLNLPKSNGLDTLETMLDAAGPVPIVVLTGLDDDRIGAEAIQHGAQDYLVKDEVTSDLLVRSIHHAVERNRQEQARAHRREQLEALHTLTRALMETRSPVELSEYVIDAAESMLGLPTLAIALYDAEEATLRPVSWTTDAASLDLESLLAVGETPGWKAFAEASPRRHTPSDDATEADDDAADAADDGPDEERGDEDTVTELTVSPLGSHGVLVAGTTTPDGFSATDLDFVETVAGTLRATLDRVDRERELRDRERTLEAQNETLERLQRINDIIRNIDQALVQASTRQEIEAVVCEQLTGVGPYELAWIGQHDRITETVVPSERAGEGTSYLDAITVRTDEGSEATGPTERAVVQGAPQVVDDVAVERSDAPWQRGALERGYRAIAALPLRYEDSIYGVPTVYAGESGVFDDLEQAVLVEMADTIAHALNAVESKKALVSQERTRLEFSIADTSVALVEVARELDCDIVAESFVPRPGGGVRGFFTTRGVEPDAVRQLAHRLPVDELSLVSTYETDGETICRFEADLTEESLVATVLDHGGRPLALRVEEGVATVEIELAADAAVREFVEMFQSRYPAANLVAQRSYEQSQQSLSALRGSLTETLTDRQLEALQTAYYSGFFETPRERTGTDIARSMGVSQPTFNRHLRRAHQRICEGLFDDPLEE